MRCHPAFLSCLFFLNDRHSSLFKGTVPKEINVITLLRCSKSSPSYHYFSENVLPFFVLVSHSWKNHGCCHATVAKWWHRNLEVLTLSKSINNPSDQDCLYTVARKIPVPALRTSGHSLESWLFIPAHCSGVCWKNLGLEIASKVTREEGKIMLSLSFEEKRFIHVETIDLIWFCISFEGFF